MSSKTIDERVVQMQFDNSKFEKNVQQSIGTIDKLKKSLNFRESIRNLNDLDNSTEGLSEGFDDVSNSLEGVASKLINLKNIFKIELFSRLANKALDITERYVKSLTIDPVLAGWNKYEEKITSVQTIMAATASTWEANAKAIGFAGTQMEFVNAQLDKLNWFSDETSFSFTDMTSNIGKFTSAGVDLDKAVTAMEGISVWAAKSGQTAQSASRAYYNLAQAMSVGSVKLMDWKSIENANMATMEFKQTAIETAEKLKYLKKVEDGVWKTVQGGTVTVENFNEALKDEWFSSEVLMQTLEEYGKAATKLSEINEEYGITTTRFLGGLEDYQEGNKQIDEIARHLGMSVEELLPLFEELNSEEYKLSLSAFKAAQEAKTFTEVINATKDAVSTGWMNTWEIIFGNYEEAKKLWSEMAEGFYNIFAEGGNTRNEILTSVMDSSFDKLMSKLSAVGISSEAFGTRLKEVFRESGIPIDEMIEKYGTLEEAMRHIANVKDYVIRALKSFIQPISDGANAILDVTDKLDDFQKVVNSVIRGNFGNGQERIKKLTEAGYDYATVQGLVNKIWERNNHTWKDTTITVKDLSEVMANMSDEELKNIGITKKQAKQLEELIVEAEESGSDLNEIINGLSKKSGRELISGTLLNFVEAINIALDSMRNTFHEVFDFNAIAGGVRAILEALYRFSEWIKMDEKQAVKFSRAFSGIVNILAIFIDLFKAIIKVFFPAFSKGLNAGISGIFDILAAFGDWIEKIRDFFRETDFFVGLLTLIKDSITSLINKIKEWLKAFREIPAVSKFIDNIYYSIRNLLDFVRIAFKRFRDYIVLSGMSFADAAKQTFQDVKKRIEELIAASPALSKIRDILSKITDKFKSITDNIGSGFLTGLKETATTIFEGIKKFVQKCLNKINEMLGIHSPSKWFIDLVWNCAKGIAEGIIQVTYWLVDKLNAFIGMITGKMLDVVRDENVRESYIEAIKKTWQDAGGIRAKLVEIFDKVVGYLRKVKDWIAEAIHNIVDYIKNLNKEELKDLLLFILDVAKTIAKIKALWEFGSGFKKMGEGFEEIGEGINSFFKGIRQKNTGKMMLMFAASVAIIIGSIIALARLSGPNLDAAVNAVGTILVIMGIIMAVISIINVANTKAAKMKLGRGERAGLAGNSILSVGLTMVAMAAAIAIILRSVEKYRVLAESDKDGQLQLIIQNMVGFIVAMLAIVEVFAIINNLTSKEGANGSSGFKAISTMLALALGLFLIIKIIEKTFFKTDEQGNLIFAAGKLLAMSKVFELIGIMLLALAASLALIAAANGGEGKGLKGVTTSILALVVGIIIIIRLIQELTDYMATLHGWGIVRFIVSLVIVFGTLYVLENLIIDISESVKNKNVSKGLLAVSLLVGVLIAFVGVLILGLRALSSNSIIRDLSSFVMIIGGVGVVLVAILVVLDKIMQIAGTSATVRVALVESLLITVSKFILALVGVIAAVALSLWLLSNNGVGQNFVNGIIILGAAAGAVFAVIKILDQVYKIVEKFSEKKVHNTVSILKAVIAFVAVLGAFALAIAAVIYLMKDTDLWGFIAGGVVVLVSLIVVIITIFKLLKTLQTMSEAKLAGVSGTLLSLTALIGVIGIVIGVMAALTGDTWAALKSGAAIAIVLGVILGIVFLFNKLGGALTTGLSIGLLLSLAACIGVIALSLGLLASKVNVNDLQAVVKAIIDLVTAISVLIFIVGAIASTGIGTIAVAIGESIIVVLAALGLAIGYVISQLTDLLIVIGVMAYGPEFAAAIATAFSTKPMNTFGDSIMSTSGIVDTATNSMASAFGNVSNSITDLLTKGADLKNFDWETGWTNFWNEHHEWEKDFSKKFWTHILENPPITVEWGKNYVGWQDYMDKDTFEYYKSKYPTATVEEIIQIVKDVNYLTYDSNGNVRVYSEDRKKADKQQEEERIKAGTQLTKEESAEARARKNLERIEELKHLEEVNGSEWMKEYLAAEHKAEESRLREIDAIIKARENLEKTQQRISEEAAEMGKQASTSFTTGFVEGMENTFSGDSGAFNTFINNIKNSFGEAFGGEIKLGSINLGDFQDINMLGEGLGINSILGEGFLNNNTTINALKDGVVGDKGLTGLFGDWLTANGQNQQGMTETINYFKEIAGGNADLVNMMNGMGVYLDGTAVGEVMSPIMDQNLMNKYVGMMRGQTR